MKNKPHFIIPRHIAIVMDGNGRWAKSRHLPRFFGHKKGVDATRKIIRRSSDLGVKCLTLFAFSSENWNRPKIEVKALMTLFMAVLNSEAKALKKHHVQMRFIGKRADFSTKLQKKIAEVEALTHDCHGMKLLIAANYGGRWDIINAAKRLIQHYNEKKLTMDDVTETTFNQFISTANVPNLDLFIRTGGETRISNFLLWQTAYSELYFTDTLWPDFDEVQLEFAIKDFSCRQRRYGKTGDQIILNKKG